jgi:glycine/D-amino acid oxidase-like deaminating enzyme
MSENANRAAGAERRAPGVKWCVRLSKRMEAHKNWGSRPWTVNFRAARHTLPSEADFAAVGGGFTGLAAAAWLKKLAQERAVLLLEAGEIGAGSSGHTGGIALAESAVGDLPGLGDVLGGYQEILRELRVDADLRLPGCYELARSKPLADSPIRWKDSGELRASKEVPGGSIDPGRAVSGLAAAAQAAGVLLFEETPVQEARFEKGVELFTSAGAVHARKALFATNAFALELSSLQGRAQAAFTTAVMTQPLDDAILEQIGLGQRKPFYTVDLPYLWGRLLGQAVIFGSGLIFFEDWRGLNSLDIASAEAVEIFARLEQRVRALHPALNTVQFTHRWGGPICIAEGWRPVFERHPHSENAIVLGAYSGHGVAQSVYLGAWAAEALLGRRELPDWTEHD